MKKVLYIIVSVLLVGCTYDVIQSKSCDTPPSATVVRIEDSDCNSASGIIEVAGSGGSGELTYSIDGAVFSSNSKFEKLAIGEYEITVRDENNCSSALIAKVQNNSGLNIDVTLSPAGCGTANGSIVVDAESGTEPYQFGINNNNLQNSNQFTGLPTGTYQIKVTDATGCVLIREVSVPSGKAFVEIKNLIQNNCATSSCHGGNISPDFRKDENILNNANRISTRTGNKSMPPGNPLSDQQIQSISCWVQDGSPKD